MLPSMPEKTVDTVVLRVEVTPEFKARLKGYSARMGISMGELLELLTDEPLRQRELETLERTRAAGKVKKGE
jgi:hypothetical protein